MKGKQKPYAGIMKNCKKKEMPLLNVVLFWTGIFLLLTGAD